MSEVELSNLQKLDISSVSDFETAEVYIKSVFQTKKIIKDVEKNTEKKCLIYYRYSGGMPPVKRRTRQLPRNPRMQPFPESIKTGQNGTKRSITRF